MKELPQPVQVAEAIAVQALTFIAADPARLGRFLAETGIGPATIRAAASDPQFLAGVLDFLLGDDSLVVAFAAHAEIEPEHVRAARDILADQSSRR
jgi:hypothetical protein